jgi:hypothetical protein
MGNTCKKLIHPEQKCNLLSHDETFARQIENNTTDIQQIKELLNNFNKDTSKSLKLIEGDIRILRNKVNSTHSPFNSLNLYANDSFVSADE